jgi:HEAT repeat protein
VPPLVKNILMADPGVESVTMALNVLARLEGADRETEELAAGALAASDEKVRLAAVNALARVGTAASVPALKASLEGRLLDLSHRRAVNGAVASIQGRLSGAGEGQVSLAEQEKRAGAVSLADDEEVGRVTLDEPEG